MQGPVIEELDAEMGDMVKFTKLDVDANPEISTAFRIMSIPTLIIKKDGKVVEQLVGLHMKDQLTAVLNQYVD